MVNIFAMSMVSGSQVLALQGQDKSRGVGRVTAISVLCLPVSQALPLWAQSGGGRVMGTSVARRTHKPYPTASQFLIAMGSAETRILAFGVPISLILPGTLGLQA